MRVTGIGEIVWDELPSGRVLGGAPFNVAAHPARLGHRTAYLTAAGDQPCQAAVAEAWARVLLAKDQPTIHGAYRG